MGYDRTSVGGVFCVRGGGDRERRFPQSDWRGIRKRDIVAKDMRGAVEEVEVEPFELGSSAVVRIEPSGT